MITTLEQAKKHLNIDSYLVEDDNYIAELIVDAEAVISSQICRDLSELDTPAGNIARRAVLLLVGEYYAQRENTVVGTAVNIIPNGVERLCALIRNYT